MIMGGTWAYHIDNYINLSYNIGIQFLQDTNYNFSALLKGIMEEEDCYFF